MTRRTSLLRRLALLEEISGGQIKADPVRVMITRRIVTKDGEGERVERRTFELYPEAHTGRRGPK